MQSASKRQGNAEISAHPLPGRGLRGADAGQRAREHHSALHQHSAGGAYVNFLMDEGQDRVAAAFRDNYARLVDVKTSYDPTNLFHLNQSIAPRT